MTLQYSNTDVPVLALNTLSWFLGLIPYLDATVSQVLHFLLINFQFKYLCIRGSGD